MTAAGSRIASAPGNVLVFMFEPASLSLQTQLSVVLPIAMVSQRRQHDDEAAKPLDDDGMRDRPVSEVDGV
jgi:hypothetical protein